ncbi:hypothetical protein AGMMS4956_20640 [Bacteroidia bacterium]|nr:hypothetical protein AGMMS4956_20640 [Bacteroidia bacterium]
MMFKFSFLFFVALAFTSCIQSEPLSSEADILSFAIPGVDLVDININTNSVYIVIENKDLEKLQNVKPQIEVSQGAKISPDTLVNLHDVKYIVTSQNGNSQKQYIIDIAQEYTDDTIHFSFDGWSTTSDGYYKLNDMAWSSGNGGITTALNLLSRPKIPESYPSQMTNDGYNGNAVRLETKRGGIIFNSLNIAVWAGNFFLGNFNTNYLLDPLKATEFGRVYKRKPHRMQGFYKYTEGPGLYYESLDKIGTQIGTLDSFARADSCSIYAVFYLADNKQTLTAYDIHTSPLVIARADLPKSEAASTSGDGFHKFDLPFVYTSEPDFDHHIYKLAILFSSSAVGGAPTFDANGKPTTTVLYAGKPGSVLIVDEVRVVNE